MAKMGRPKLDMPKNKIVTFRLLPQTYDKLTEYAANNNLTVTEAIHEGVEMLFEKAAAQSENS